MFHSLQHETLNLHIHVKSLINLVTVFIYIHQDKEIFEHKIVDIVLSSILTVVLGQASKYLKIGTCPSSQNYWHIIYGKKISLEISKFSLALQPEALVNTS